MSTTKSRKKRSPKHLKPIQIYKTKIVIPGGPSLMQWRKEQGINRALFAKMADCSERKMASFEKAPKIPDHGLRRIRETIKLIQALQELSGDSAALKDWLHKPNKAFQKRTPLQLITEGESDTLWEMVHQIRQGSFG